MPTYRIVAEFTAENPHRETRSARVSRWIDLVEADNFVDALANSTITKQADLRITSAEEIHPGLSITDDQLRTALIDSMPPGHWAGVEPSFSDLVQDVATALRDTEIIAGLTLSVTDETSSNPYVMVEIYDVVRDTYFSHGTDLVSLTSDQHATGVDAAVAVARSLITISNDLQ